MWQPASGFVLASVLSAALIAVSRAIRAAEAAVAVTLPERATGGAGALAGALAAGAALPPAAGGVAGAGAELAGAEPHELQAAVTHSVAAARAASAAGLPSPRRRSLATRCRLSPGEEPSSSYAITYLLAMSGITGPPGIPAGSGIARCRAWADMAGILRGTRSGSGGN